jgi:stress response protein YsnF
MAPLDIDTALDWRGRTVVDRHGEKIGTFDELYLDADDRPAWAAVRTGLFGRRQTFVPLSEAQRDGDDLRVPFDKGRVEAAPNVDPDEQLTDEEEDRLHEHYGLGPAGLDADAAADADDGGGAQTAVAGEATAGRDDAEGDARAASGGDDSAEVIRSEEELVVGTRRRPATRVRLKKYLVTEHVTRKVPVRREEVRVEYDPPEGQDAPPSDDR